MSYIATTHFGLTAVREQTPSANDWAATYWNWILADTVLYNASTAHLHDGQTALANPAGVLSISTATSGGTLPAGKTYYVAATFLDYLGRETSISTVGSVTTTAVISTPATPTYVAGVDRVAVASGLTGDLYWYKITYGKGSGETVGSTPVAVTIPTDQTYQATIHFDSLTTVANGADAINVYRKKGNNGEYVKISSITSTSRDYYTDDNTAVAQCDTHPPTDNSTNSFNTITVDFSGITNLVDAEYLNLYVSTTTDGATATWLQPSMKIVGSIDLNAATMPSTHVWAGEALLSGKPPQVSQSLPNPSRIDLGLHAEGNLLWANLPSDFTWGEPVATVGALPATGVAGEVVVVQDEKKLYLWDSTAATPVWMEVSGSGLGLVDTGEEGTAWLSKVGSFYRLNVRHDISTASWIPTYLGGAGGMKDYLGWLGVADDDTSFYPAAPYYGYGCLSYVWNKDALYYYEDTYSPSAGVEGWYKTGFSTIRGSYESVADLPAIADDGDLAMVRTDGAATPTVINYWYIYEGAVATPSWSQITAVGGAFNWNTDAATPHSSQDHTGIPGVGGGDFVWADDAATPHATVNHAGILGIPVITTVTSLNNTCTASSSQNIDIAAIPSLVVILTIAATDGAATPAVNYDFEIYTDAGRTQYAYRAVGITTLAYEDKIPWYWEGTTMYVKVLNNLGANITDLDITIKYR